MIPVMIIVSVLYPRHGESQFDHEYYRQKHMPLVEQRWSGMGLVKMEWMRGVAAPDGGEPGYEVITLLTFLSREAFEAGLAAFGEEILGDIPNFTNVQPLVQINQPVSGTINVELERTQEEPTQDQSLWGVIRDRP